MSEQEITLLRRKIEAVYEKMLLDVANFEGGEPSEKLRMDVISACMDKISQYQRQLTRFMSDIEAANIVSALYEQAAARKRAKEAASHVK